ncbi:MAG: hypothetical protein OQK82_00825 [Candidatus Pacearchaeota archaeon]|nr:hypothetical protein [Candidatus Pacearchaeota archaeon]
MKKTKIIFTLVLLTFSPLILATSIVSDNYSTNSFHTGLTGYSDENFTSTLGYQQLGKTTQNENYSINLGFYKNLSSGKHYCGDKICNSTETCSTCSADCGSCSTTTGGGGGTRTCTYDWVCSEWYPQTCPKNEIQEKICVNKGTCSDTKNMPQTKRNCTYIETEISPKDPLFDLFIDIPLKNKLVPTDGIIKAEVTLINKGNTTPLDVFFTYWITDKNNKLILESKETRAISEKETFTISQEIPKNTQTGLYKFYTQITYDTNNKIALASDTFYITKNKTKIILILLAIPATILLISIIYFIIRIYKTRFKTSEYPL